jgi:hypothetical protein
VTTEAAAAELEPYHMMRRPGINTGELLRGFRRIGRYAAIIGVAAKPIENCGPIG